MLPEQTALRQAIATERARLLELLWQDIVTLRQMVDRSQQLVDAARAELHGRVVGTAAVLLPSAEQDIPTA
jgi:hypothetical protein